MFDCFWPNDIMASREVGVPSDLGMKSELEGEDECLGCIAALALRLKGLSVSEGTRNSRLTQRL